MRTFTRLHSALSRPSLGGYLAPEVALHSPSLGLATHSPYPYRRSAAPEGLASASDMRLRP
jgi:hypothetical protein